MQANYARESLEFRFLFEANAGIRLSARGDVWLDVGVLPSPFGYEGAVNLLQNTLTRSLSAEYSPYYLSGARLALTLSNRVQLNLFAINGWQIIRESNLAKSGAAQLQVLLTDELLLNYSTYLGKKRPMTDTTPGPAYRSFHDVYLHYQPTDRVSFVALFDMGTQNGYDRQTQFWHTTHVTARYHLLDRLSVSMRGEYYSDPGQLLVSLPIHSGYLFGGSVGLNYGLTDKLLLRYESRVLNANGPAFEDRAGRRSDTYMFNTAALSVYF